MLHLGKVEIIFRSSKASYAFYSISIYLITERNQNHNKIMKLTWLSIKQNKMFILYNNRLY